MKLAFLVVTLGLSLAGAGVLSSQQNKTSDKPQAVFNGEQLVRPEGFRDWVFLSSGLGMNYNAVAGGPDLFTNVFVPQWAYREFVATGKWPEKSIFVIEERASESQGSINKHGHYQTDLTGLAVEVKDSARFPDRWAYFTFDAGGQLASPRPKQACWQCHEDNAAVEHTFVQFYPTLKPVAQKFGVYRQAAEAPAP